MWDAELDEEEGGSILLARGKLTIPFTGRTDRALGHYVL